MPRKTTGKRGQKKGRGEVPGMSDRGCCLRLWHTVALGGDRRALVPAGRSRSRFLQRRRKALGWICWCD